MGANKTSFLADREADQHEQNERFFPLAASVFSCRAIHLNEPVMIGTGEVVTKLTPGMEIAVAHENELINCDGIAATHLIRECCRNAAGTRAKITASDLNTGKLITIDFTA